MKRQPSVKTIIVAAKQVLKKLIMPFEILFISSSFLSGLNSLGLFSSFSKDWPQNCFYLPQKVAPAENKNEGTIYVTVSVSELDFLLTLPLAVLPTFGDHYLKGIRYFSTGRPNTLGLFLFPILVFRFLFFLFFFLHLTFLKLFRGFQNGLYIFWSQ